MAWWEAQGISPRQLRTFIRSGQLVRTRHGIYATRSAVDLAQQTRRLGHALELRSAMLAVGGDGDGDGDAVASHQSAAIIHGIDLLRDPPAGLVTLTRTRKHDRHGYKDVVFRTGELPPRHVTKWRHIPVTTIPRTVVDLARTLPFMEGVVAADAALRTREIAPSEFEPVLESCARWPGLSRAREVVEFADMNAGSVLESCLRVLLREWGFSAPATQVTIVAGNASFTVDFLYPDQRTIIEADGKSKYKDQKNPLKQFDRDQLLRDAGYKVVHVTWDEVFRRPQVVISRIRKALAATGPY